MLTVFELSEQIGLFLEPGQDLPDLQVGPAVRGLTDDADHTFVYVGWYVVRAHADSPVLLHRQHLGSVILALLILQSVNFKHRTELKRIVDRTTQVQCTRRRQKNEVKKREKGKPLWVPSEYIRISKQSESPAAGGPASCPRRGLRTVNEPTRRRPRLEQFLPYWRFQ